MPTKEPPFEQHLRVMAHIAEYTRPAVWETSGKYSEDSAIVTDQPCVFYINLDSHTKRRQNIETQLSGLAWGYQRIRAIEEPYPLMGCLKSHIKALRLAKEKKHLWTAVFEDDFSFALSFQDVRERIEYIHEHKHLAPVWIGDWVVNGPQPMQHPVNTNIKLANGACNNASCYFVRHDYIDVLLGTWEAALENFITELKSKVVQKRAGTISEIAPIWWYSPDAAWAPLQIRDYWHLFAPQLGRQQGEVFESSISSSYSKFDKTGYLQIDLSQLTAQID